MRKAILGLAMTLMALTASVIPALAAQVTRNDATVTPPANSNASAGLAHHTQAVKVPSQATDHSKALI